MHYLFKADDSSSFGNQLNRRENKNRFSRQSGLLKWSFRQAFNYSGERVLGIACASSLHSVTVVPHHTCPRWVLHSCLSITELLGIGTDHPINHPCSNHICFPLAFSNTFYRLSQLFIFQNSQYLSYISCRVLIQD